VILLLGVFDGVRVGVRVGVLLGVRVGVGVGDSGGQHASTSPLPIALLAFLLPPKVPQLLELMVHVINME
jgi:hypothetical protein